MIFIPIVIIEKNRKKMAKRYVRYGCFFYKYFINKYLILVFISFHYKNTFLMFLKKSGGYDVECILKLKILFSGCVFGVLIFY